MRRVMITVGAMTLALAGCAGGGEGTATNAEGDEAAAGCGGYPDKAIEMIVAFDAGGSTDVGARLMAQELEDELGVPVTVQNRPGAGGQVGYTYVANADPDGYTMGVNTLPSIVIAAVDESRGADYTSDSFAPVALQVVDPGGMMVAADSPIDSVEDLVEAAKQSPGEITAATTGIGTGDHVGMLLLEQAADIDLQPVHFTGSSEAASAFLGGNNVDVLIANVSDLATLVENGSGKIVGLTAEEPSPLLPDVPTFAEAGYEDVITGSARGYMFPAGVEECQVEIVSEAMANVMENPEFEQQMLDQGLAPVFMGAAEYQEYWDNTVQSVEEVLPLFRED